MLPKVAFTGFASRYREPKVEEGLQDISKVDFKVSARTEHIPVHHIAHSIQQFQGSEEQKLQWQKFWIS